MAVTDELIAYYKSLLIIQYVNKPKAKETIGVLADLAVMNNLPVQIKNAFEIDSAVGVQLDVIGKYLDISRISYGGVVSDDVDYRVLIKLKILQANASSDLYSIQDLIANYFPGYQILIFDYKTMRMGYFINTSAMTRDLAEKIVEAELLPSPMAVALSSTIYINDIEKLFGMRDYILDTANIKPFNNYTAYDTDAPWLSYVDAL